MTFKDGSYILKQEDVCGEFLNVLYSMCRYITDKEQISRIITNHMELRVNIINNKIIDVGGLPPPDTYFHRRSYCLCIDKTPLNFKEHYKAFKDTPLSLRRL